MDFGSVSDSGVIRSSPVQSLETVGNLLPLGYTAAQLWYNGPDGLGTLIPDPARGKLSWGGSKGSGRGAGWQGHS